MLKSILAVLAGLIAGSIVVFLVEGVGSFIYPLPDGIDPRDMEAVKSIMSDMPAGALVMILIAWAAGAFAAGLFTAMIAPKSKAAHSIITGAILLVFALINMIMIPHPAWFMIIGILLYIPFAYMGGKIIERKSNQYVPDKH